MIVGSLPDLADTPADTISVETAQSCLDPATLRPLRGKGIALGVLDLSTPEVETPETVAVRVRRALDHVDVDRLVLSSDCGLKYLPRAAAAGKMRALAQAAVLLRSEVWRARSGSARNGPLAEADVDAPRTSARSWLHGTGG